MIEKERLQELIEQEATIWFVYKGNVDMKEGIYKDDFILGETHLSIYWSTRSHALNYEDLFETQEEAEWHKEFGCIEKPQYLKFPNWKQIESSIEYMRKFGLNHNDRVLARIITNDSIYYFKLCKDLDLFTFELKQTYIGDDLCEQIRDKFPKNLGKATKENYYEACKLVKILFLGEKK